MNKEKPTLLDWLCIKSEFDHSKQRVFGGLVGAVLILATLVLALISLISLGYLFAGLLGHGAYAGDETGSGVRNLGLLIAATVGLPFLIWRSIVAQKQVNVAEQGHITDRINEAVQGLGAEKVLKEVIETPRYKKDENDEWEKDEDDNPVPALRPDGEPIIKRESFERTTPNLEVRIGSIYSLERIAQDSPRDHIQIMEILCAYVRENAPALSLEPSDPPPEVRAVPRIDIQAVINVIGRRTDKQIKLEWENQYRLDLRNTDLSGVDFRKKNFSAAMIHRARLEAALFDDCKLIGTQFNGSLLNFSRFYRAELRGTWFNNVILNQPEPFPGGMTESINMGSIYGISLVGADISALDYLGEPKEMNLTFGSKDTKLGYELEEKRKDYSRELHQIRTLRKQGNSEEANKLEEEVYSNGFVDWFAHDQYDGALGWSYECFLNRLEINKWPYRD